MHVTAEDKISTASLSDGDVSSPPMLTFASGSGDGEMMCTSVTANFDNLVEFEEDFSLSIAQSCGRSIRVEYDATPITIIDSDGM